jgi:hypothetical protein
MCLLHLPGLTLLFPHPHLVPFFLFADGEAKKKRARGAFAGANLFSLYNVHHLYRLPIYFLGTAR